MRHLLLNLKQYNKNSEFGLAINWNFHRNNNWVCAQSSYLVEEIVKEFDPIIITSQLSYEFYKSRVDKIISLEPGWAAPTISYDLKQSHTIAVFVSDPHSKTDWFDGYVDENDINYVLSYYYHPFLQHFPNFDKERLIHMPWAMPDDFISGTDEITFNDQTHLNIFGATKGEAYKLRNWCRGFDFVKSHENSGVENKVMSDAEYFKWTQNFDAIIAAGSLSKKYQLVTPKYFEIAGAGSLLFAQYCEDLDLLGFDKSNCIIFDKSNFQGKAKDYLENPQDYLQIRKNGVKLIQNKHKISDRIKELKELFN